MPTIDYPTDVGIANYLFVIIRYKLSFSKVVIKILLAHTVPEVIGWRIVSDAKKITGTIYACLIESDCLYVIYAVFFNKGTQFFVLLWLYTSTLISDYL